MASLYELFRKMGKEQLFPFFWIWSAFKFILYNKITIENGYIDNLSILAQ